MTQENELNHKSKGNTMEKFNRIYVIAPNGEKSSVIPAGNGMVQTWSGKRKQWESFPIRYCKILKAA